MTAPLDVGFIGFFVHALQLSLDVRIDCLQPTVVGEANSGVVFRN